MAIDDKGAKERFTGFKRRSQAAAEAGAQQSAAGPAEASAVPAGTPGEPRASFFAELPLDAVVPKQVQQRRTFHRAALERLGRSIERIGLIEPIVVVPIEFDALGEPTKYQIRAGERRWRAMRMVGFKTITASIMSAGAAEDPEVQLLDAEVMSDENAFREDLNIIENAMQLDSLIERRMAVHLKKTGEAGERKKFVAVIAQERGLSVSEVYRRLSLLDAPAYLQDALAREDESKTPSRAQAYALVDYAGALIEKRLRDPLVAKGKRLHDDIREWVDSGGKLADEDAEPLEADGEAAGGEGEGESAGEVGTKTRLRVDADVLRALPNYCKVARKKLPEVRALLKKYGSAMARAEEQFRTMVDGACDPKKRHSSTYITGARKKLLAATGGSQEPAAGEEAAAAPQSDSEGHQAPAVEFVANSLWSMDAGRLVVSTDQASLAAASAAELEAARRAVATALAAIDAALEAVSK